MGCLEAVLEADWAIEILMGRHGAILEASWDILSRRKPEEARM